MTGRSNIISKYRSYNYIPGKPMGINGEKYYEQQENLIK